MFTPVLARALVASLSATHHTTVVFPDDPAAVIVRGGLSALARAVPALAPLANEVMTGANNVSVTFPIPGGACVLLSPAAVADPVSLAATGAHEHQHAVQLATGALADAIDYLTSPELRACAEADAYGVGLCVRWFLSGEIPSLDDAIQSLSGETYMLAADQVELARGILQSHLATMGSGLCHPLTIAREVLLWLRATHPEALIADVA